LDKNNIKELSIQINLNGLSFCILNRTTYTIEYINTLPFENKLTPFDTLNRLKTELSSNSVFSESFNSVTIVHQNELSSLVPKKLYSETHKADFLKFNSKILRTDFITQDDIIINESVNVYIPYVNINNYIFETFGEFIYKHSSTILVDTILQKKNVGDQTEVFININAKSIEVLVVKNNNLQLFNSFEYNNKEDFIYYVLFVFEQLKLDVETTPVNLSGQIDENDALFNIIYTYVRHIEIQKPDVKFKLKDTVNKNKLHHHYLILNTF